MKKIFLGIEEVSYDKGCELLKKFKKYNIQTGWGVEFGNNVTLEPNIVIESYAQIGDNVHIENNVHIGSMTKLGENSRVRAWANIEHDVELGERADVGQRARSDFLQK